MKKLSQILEYEVGPEDEREISALVEKVKANGVDEEFLNKVLASSESAEDTVADLRVLAEPKGKRITPKTPPLPPYERELEVFEEQIFLEMLEGEHQPVTTVG